MNLTELLENLSAKNVELRMDGDKLRCRAPENVLTPELLAQIKQYKQEIILFLSNAADHPSTYALSHGQQALWFLYQLAPKSTAYNTTYAARLVTNLDIAALKQATQVLIERHPVLRTTFTSLDGEPVQTVQENQQVDFSIIEASALGLEDVNKWLKETSDRPFDLEKGPLLCFSLLINHTTLNTLATKEHFLLITAHHIVVDFWSLEIIVSELRVLYEAITTDVEPLLQPQNCQYRDYVNWSKQILAGIEGERLSTYWRQQLSGDLPVLNLPKDRPRPKFQTYNGASYFFALEEKLLQKLKELASEEGVSLYTLLLSALQILLLRYTNQRDILIGSPTVNRSRLEFENIVGYFTNPVVLRTDMSGNPTFQELLGRSRSSVLEALDHQDYPFPLLVEEMQPVRDLSYSPLYQVAFAWDRSHQSEGKVSITDSDGLIVESMIPGAQGAAFDLTLTILDVPGALKGTWNYNTDLFDASTIERMTQHYVTLLEGIVANPAEHIAQLPLLTESEEQQLLVEWNRTQTDYPSDSSIHSLFEAQSWNTPDAVAVVYENQQLTYAELNTQANQLAHYLKSIGVGPDVLVGICVERSLEMVVGLLGILKADGAYVPLDPEYPTERLSFMLSDSGVTVLLTETRLVARLGEPQGRVVCLDTDWQQICRESTENLYSSCKPLNLAYVIYTSGSTGKPKGAMNSHHSVCNRLLWMQKNYVLTLTDSVLQKTPFSFDVSVWELFWPLFIGARLVVAKPGGHRDSAYLVKMIAQHRITTLHFVPSMLQIFLEEQSLATCSSLRQVFCSGEALPKELVERFFERMEYSLHNLYGPTEAAIDVTFWQCRPQNTLSCVPIGRPIANTQIYIFDRDLQPLPIGVAGEVYIGGVGVARGYLHRPELTAEKFIPHPWSDKLGERLYKTGDLARYMSDGNIQYLGRLDYQVKIRGFRIELGEIEALLAQHPAVWENVVVVRSDELNDKRLVAYVVPQNDVTLTISSLRQFLQAKLPDYMVPSAIVILESIPLTPNSKIDKNALPSPDLSRERLNQFVAPRTPIEEILILNWVQVLKVEVVSIHDNFFTLGGHSLLATQLISRIRSNLGIELPLRSLFAAPTVAELAQVVIELQQQNLQLVIPPILPRDSNAFLPLSFAQQRLWFLDQLEPSSALYNIPIALRLVGTLNVGALEQSLSLLIARHEALRTNIISVSGQPVQIIHSSSDWTLAVVDGKDLARSDLDIIATQQLLNWQALQPFDLATGALLRATLLVLSPTEHILLVCMHHIISDGWSMGVFLQEISALYNADSPQHLSELAPLPIQYADFAIWQRQWLTGSVLQTQLAYWQKQLSDAPALLSLPTDRPRPSVQTFCGTHQQFTLSIELSRELTQLSQQLGVTLFMTLLAGFETLLYRYTGQTDILVGTPIANRNRREIEGLIGFFVNTIVLRTDLADNPSFSELLERVKSMALSAYAHQDLPLEMLVEALQPERDLSYTPLFQVMFVLQNAPLSSVELTGLSVTPLPLETHTAKFDLSLSMENTNSGLVGVWEYNTDLFDASTIERMSGHFVTLLESIVANPVEHIAQLPLLTELEQQQLLVEWNQTQTDYACDKCIHQLFEAQVELTPDAVAVVYENQQLTYAQLNTQANQLAHYLKSIGVGADVLVGICVERSLEMVVGLLGILKAGGAYVPLDPEYPTERLSFMLTDAAVSVLLTQKHLQQRLPEHTAKLVYLDIERQLISQSSQENSHTLPFGNAFSELIQQFQLDGNRQDLNCLTDVHSNNLAYVIYTSGSTGTPKGVMVRHSGLCNLAQAQLKKFGVQNSSRILQFASLSFDASISEILMALGSGATLHLVTKDSLVPGMPLIEQLRNHCITHITLPPSVLAVMPVEELPALQTMIVAGSASSAQLIKQWCSGRNFFNAYGPTEATVCATVAKCSDGEKNISIGRPISNTQIYILDQYLQPVPIGVPGELHIGGAGLARGYLNRPELTQQKFIPNPFSTDLSSRLYKTGDLARYLSDGNIEYLERLDNQVKIRGFRIELGEIETVLSQHPDVHSVVVIARVDLLGDQRLVAYVVPQNDVTLTISSLRQFLQAKLPDYMVPSAIVILESIPLTPNGKIDKNALPSPDLSRERLEQFVAPRTPIEEILILNWVQVLKVEVVSIHDNFFTLGGHSLLATQLISRIRSNLGIELPLRSLFAAPTAAELAQVVIELQQQNLQLVIPPILPRDSNAFLPLSFAQQRLWFLDQLEPSSALYNIPIALRLVGTLNVGALEQSLSLLIARHEALRTNIISVSGQPVQIIHSSSDWTLAVVDGKDLARSDLDIIATQQLLNWQALQPFDLATGALLRATLVVLSPTEHILLVCMHHIISDGWSMGVFVQEISALYNADSPQHLSELAPLPIQYADFAIWQRQWLTGSVLQTQLAYWQKQLSDAPALLSLPTDRPRPSVQTFCGTHQQFTLSIELSRELTQLSQQLGVTLFMTLLAGFETLLYRYTGQTDILVGTPIANRNRREIEGLIGFFVNTIVLRTDLADNPSFSELLERVKSMALSAYAHQDLPLEMLVEALQPERDLSYTPLFQVMFVLQNAPLSSVELTGLSVTPLPLETHTAKFDLSLSMENTNSGLVGVWEYNTDLFDASTIERMSGHFVTLLESIVANPVEHIAQLPLLTELEQQQLLVEWNQTQTDYACDKCIHQLFEAQVELTPDAVAVVYENQQLTYAQLNTQANQLAHYLKSIGVGADVLVGICVERSLEMVVGLLGILKAGGAYVPLDPEYPTERLSFMLTDAAVSVLLTQKHLQQRLPEHTAKLVYLDIERQLISQSSQENSHTLPFGNAFSELIQQFQLDGNRQDLNCLTDVHSNNLAYVIYTSGSTGTPKGVMVRHSGLCNLAQAQLKKFGVQNSSRILQFASLSFDASISEILMALGSGATLHLVTKDSLVPGMPLIEQLRNHCITHITLPPSVLAVMPVEELPALQTMIVAGSASSAQLIKQWCSGRNFFNAYGPTEATVCATVAKCSDGEKNISIGRPISNTQIYILDQYLQPVPIGVPGELHIGGAGLARGYLNRPELTQQKFIPNPFSTDLSSRLYKTGDLARYLSDGNIEYLERLDNQVKIRGFRIELGEIETVLSQHPDVHSVVVIARVDLLGDQRLVAYVVPQNDVTLTISSLRQFLQAKLPDYMVPSAIVILESIPLTPNGKIDKNALPSPDLSRERLNQFVAPRTPIEEILILNWVQVLKVEVVSIHDNFFTLGGHSLLATQLISRIRSNLGIELPLRSLFAAPTAAELAQVVIELQQQNLQLVIPPILPRDSNAFLPLSFAQQRLWFLDQLEPSSALYNIPIALRLVGTLNVGALEQSLSLLIARHEALRTNIISVSGQPVQIIHSSSDWTLAVVDGKDLARSDLDIIATQQLLNWQALQPFDLATGALLRATLLVLSPTEHILLVCMHHIISDGWSMGVFVQEISALYNADSPQHLSELAPLPIQYADFAIWQRNWLTGSVLQTQLAYWQKQLSDAPALLSLPTDRPRPSVQTFCGAHQQFTLSIELSRELTQLSQQLGVTLFMTLLAGFETLLYRYTGQTDILVGTPIANRNLREIEGLIGFFVNTIVLRTDLADNPSFSELLERVKSMALSAYAHQDLPLEMLVEALQPERDLSYTPLFQVMFVLQNAPLSEVELTGLSVSPLPLETHSAKFDLSLSMENTNSVLVGVWEYNTDLFDASTIERMSGHFVTLLEGIVANPVEHIAQLPLLTELEQQQLLVEWNDTRVDYTCDKCIHQLFEAQSLSTPDAVAVVFENQQLTYHELNCRANQLAHYLRSLGVSPDVLVGMCVERSIEMVVGLLGILKAGGAYVPLDPEYPTERLSFMLSDAQVSVLLTQQHLIDNLPECQAQLVCLDADWQVISQLSQDNLITGVQAGNLTYVIYTSGSTGIPKGVLISHGAIANHCSIIQQAYALRKSDRVLQFASINFDASLEQIFPTLLVGATLVLRGSDVWTPTIFQKIIADFQLTVVNLPTAYWQQLAQESVNTLVLQANSQLRLVLVGGDVMLPSDVALWQQSPMCRVRLVNAYGPTETTITATLFEILPQLSSDINLKKIPIGRPLSNKTIYILDSHLQPVPVGVPGELHIGGVSLATGYLNRPELTQQKFIPNPFSADSHSRLYKTGDLARYLSDGNIEYLGRIDNQVKVRGFRIELGEIESVLSQHPHVQASCIIALEDIPGNKRLVAYVLLQLKVTSTISELRQFLKAKLPDFMVPTAIVILDSLPLTPNAKIDKSALPAPESRGGIEVSLVAPRTPIEEILALIWAEVLRVPLVGIHDNFFELGGDSILSIQIISRAKQANVQLSVKQLFAHQTIAELATVAVTSREIQILPEQGLVTGKSPLTPIQHWFFEQKLPQPHHFNQSFLLCIPSNFQPGLLELVWQQLLLHHDALRLRFTQSQLGWQQIHSDPSEHIAFSFIDLSAVPETEYLSAIVATATSLQANLALEENLVQVAYFWLGVDKKARLLIIIHHLVVDGVSWRILLEDLLTAYQQLESGKAIQLPAKTTSFKDWGQHLTEYAQTEVFTSEIAYWLRGSRAAVAPIPVDYAVGANTVATANTVSVSLNEAETFSLLLDVPKAYKTQINDVLLTALVLVLSKWTHSDSVLFNLEGHGREDIIDDVDLSRTVGWFTTIFPVHVELSTTDKQHLGTALKSVKEQLRAIPHKGIGYGLLRYLSSDTEIAAQLQTQTLAEISFNYLGQFTQVLNTSSLMQLAPESSGQSHSLQGKRPYLLDINGIITNERLQIDWTYSTNIHQQSTIENIALEFVATLRELITHCLSPENRGYTPTDFPLVKFDQRELDQVLADLELKPQDSKTHSTSVEDIYPLSPMQQGMLFESLYAPDSGVYFESLICTLKGNVDVPAFNTAWQQVVARHSIFRTAFIWESLNQPLQVVYRQVPVTLLTYDWRELSVEQQKQQLEVFLDSERQQGLPLSQAPLMRLHLIQLDRDTYEFVWSSHHLLLDGWSSALVFNELLNFYQAESQGERLTLQPTVSYRNYIAWLQQQDVANSMAFWRQKLQGFSAPTPITVDRLLPRDNGNDSFGEQFLQLTLPSSAAVQSFARQHQLTINNLVQATWALLLCRYSQKTDVVFGMTVSGRPPELMGVESMVGLLINTLPMRVKISQQTKLLDLLKDLQAQIVESEQFSYSSLVDIQGFSDVPRGMPLFESIVVFENYPVDSAVLQDNGSFSLSNLRAFGRTNYPLTVVVSPGEQLLVKVSYDSGRFDYATISRMLGHFETMLSAIVADPNRHVMELPILTELEQQQLLIEWNNTLLEYPQDSCIHTLFEAQVKRTPDAVAVVYENQQLTYTELNARANQLAHYLQQRGVGAEVVVALYVERSLFLMVGMLGILKAGAAYLPLEPTYPTERLALMLEDAKVPVLLTQQQLVKTFPEYTVEAICLDTDWDKIAHQSQENLQSGVKPENLAYVLFTSGSTGQPKGVAVEHRQLYNYLNAIIERLDLSISKSFAYLSTIAADLGNTTIFPSLCNGGCLHIVSLDRATNPEALADYFHCHPIDCFKIVPSHLAALLTSSRPEQILPRQSLILGGDVCSWQLIEQIRQLTSECQIFNHYGPTEATVGVLTYAIAPGHTERFSHTVPIGCPIANTLIYILDSNLQPVPIGVPGELHIGGAGLARGYLNRPQLTLEKFIPNPFSSAPHSRLYKTGDLARYLPDGNIEYLGRIDHQVKIRGFRIELGEIETVLSQHPQIHSVVVIAHENLPGDQNLVAYVVPHHDLTPTISSLRQFLLAKLPDYMVPSTLVILESLPMTPNGKIDRRALRVPSNSSTSDTFVSPRNTVELQLMQIWSKILKVDNVGVKDNFFDLGGHSLLAVYLMAQIKQQFGKDIPLATLFQHPTIEQLATVVQLDMPTSGCSPLVPIQSIGSKPPLFCLPGAGGNPFYLYNLARCLGPDQPFYSLQVIHLERLVPITRVEDIAAYYIHAIQAIQPLGPYFFAGHSFGGKVVFEMAQQLLSQGQVVALVAILDTTAPRAQEKQIDNFWDDARWLIEFARTLKIVFAKDLDLDAEKLSSLAPDEQLKYVLEYLKMLDIVPYDVDSTYLKQLVSAFKADINAEYAPQQTQKLPITLLRARDTDLEQPVSASLSEILQDSAWGWSAFSSVPVDVQFVSGNHITMMTQPHVQVLAERLNACIQQAMKKMGLPETLN